MRKAAEVILIVIAIILIALLCVNLTSCRQADKVSYNVSREADSFNVCRKITVINSRTDTIIYELEGVFSLKNSVNNELEIVCRTGENGARRKNKKPKTTAPIENEKVSRFAENGG